VIDSGTCEVWRVEQPSQDTGLGARLGTPDRRLTDLLELTGTTLTTATRKPAPTAL
jgi:hypothetical protein